MRRAPARPGVPAYTRHRGAGCDGHAQTARDEVCDKVARMETMVLSKVGTIAASVWTEAMHLLAPLATWTAARAPAGIPRWAWAIAVVVIAYLIGRLGGRLLSGLLRWGLLAAGVVIAWQILHGTVPGPHG